MKPRLDVLGILLLTLLRLRQHSLALVLAHQLGEVTDFLLRIVDRLDEGLIQCFGYGPSVRGAKKVSFSGCLREACL